MTPQIRNGIAIFSPQGFIDGNNAPLIINNEDLKFLNRIKARGIMISFEKVIFFNKNGINYLTDTLLKIRKSKNVEVGIVCYKNDVYKQLVHFYKGSPEIHLLQSLKVLDLLIDGKKEEEHKVIIYNKDSDQRGSLLMRLKEKGVEGTEIAKTPEEYREKIKLDQYEITIDSTYLTLFSKKVPYYTKDNAVVYGLDGYIDGEIKESFDYEYHNNSLAVGFKVFIFNCTTVNSFNTHAVNFFNRLAVTGAEYGAAICLTGLDYSKVPEVLQEEMKAGGIFFEDSLESALQNEDIIQEDDGATVVKKEQKTISKKLVKEVSIFVDATVETIEVMTGAESHKENVQIGGFNISTDKEFISASVGFFEDLDGMLFLFFPREIARRACLLLLGEKAESITDELDALSELINIITGRVKAVLLNQKGITIKNTLPRTFGKMEKTKSVIADRKGVYVQMAFDGEPFYFFLTR
ncbi:MAG: chemotaxis protein CheX [Campylobacterales bacterium]|nr:chemotaxis protein CheX [Campylobacterales bacterium]